MSLLGWFVLVLILLEVSALFSLHKRKRRQPPTGGMLVALAVAYCIIIAGLIAVFMEVR